MIERPKALIFHLLLAATICTRTLAAQLPLARPNDVDPASSSRSRPAYQPASDDDLDWDKRPDQDATSRFIFNSASELMQLWAGHVVVEGQSFAPAIIPTGTVLYHGRANASVPTVPEWFAFDFEHSYFFAYGNDAHVLTAVTKRPMRVLIFDGMSAHLSLDTQDVLVHGRVVEDDNFGHFDKPGKGELPPFSDPTGGPLCAWGEKNGIDGFIRLEMNHELIACDFGRSFTLLEAIHVIPPERRVAKAPPKSPWDDRTMPRPDGWVGSLPNDTSIEVFVAAGWHYGFPGETRVKPVYSKFVTFYDPALTSLVESRRGKTRDHHRLQNISEADARAKVQELEEVVARSWDESVGSRVDWQSILHVVVERYGDRLEVLNHTLSSISSQRDAYTTAFSARQQVLMMLAPHFTTSDTPANASSSSSNPKAWLTPVWQRCATRHTQGVSTELFTPQEHLILGAVEDVMAEICRRLTRMFYVSHDIQSIDGVGLRGEQDRLVEVVRSMSDEVRTLMEWLDWVQAWSRCRPACSLEEICIATSPSIGFPFDLTSATVHQDSPPISDAPPKRRPRWRRGSGGQRIPKCIPRPHFSNVDRRMP